MVRLLLYSPTPRLFSFAELVLVKGKGVSVCGQTRCCRGRLTFIDKLIYCNMVAVRQCLNELLVV